MTKVIPTRVIHAEADAVAGLGFCGAGFGLPWMTEVIPTWVIHAEADAVVGLGFCGADFSLPCLG